VERGHLAAAHFMENLSRLRVAKRIGHLGLIGGEAPQHALCHVRAPPQHLQRGNEAVATKRRRKPRDTSIRIAALRRIRHQHREIGRRPAQNLIETVVRRFNRCPVAGRLAQFAACQDKTAEERQRAQVGSVAAHGQKQRPHLSGGEVKVIDGGVGRKPVGLRIEGQRGAPHLPIEPVVGQQHLVIAAKLRCRAAAAVAVRSADFE